MKPQRFRIFSALAVVGLLFSAAPAHADDVSPAPSTFPIIIKPDPAERFPTPRPPSLPICPVKPAPPGWMVPLYCDISPIKPPVDRVDPMVPGPIMPSPIIREDAGM